MTEQPTTIQEVRNQRIGTAVRTLGLILMQPDEGPDKLLRALNLRSNLTDQERAHLLEAVVMTFPADLAERLIVDIFGEAGLPTGTISGRVIDEARFWARDASPAELRGYAQACLEALSQDGKRAVHSWLGKQLASDSSQGAA